MLCWFNSRQDKTNTASKSNQTEEKQDANITINAYILIIIDKRSLEKLIFYSGRFYVNLTSDQFQKDCYLISLEPSISYFSFLSFSRRLIQDKLLNMKITLAAMIEKRNDNCFYLAKKHWLQNGSRLHITFTYVWIWT